MCQSYVEANTKGGVEWGLTGVLSGHVERVAGNGDFSLELIRDGDVLTGPSTFQHTHSPGSNANKENATKVKLDMF